MLKESLLVPYNRTEFNIEKLVLCIEPIPEEPPYSAWEGIYTHCVSLLIVQEFFLGEKIVHI